MKIDCPLPHLVGLKPVAIHFCDENITFQLQPKRKTAICPECNHRTNANHHIVATHEHAKEPGERHTHPDHLPQEKVCALPRTPQNLKEQAEQIGPHTRTLVEAILSDPVLDKTASAGRLLRLAETHSNARLEAACGRALRCCDPCYTTVRDILAKGLEAETPPVPQAPPATTFARSARELFAQFKGAFSWM